MKRTQRRQHAELCIALRLLWQLYFCICLCHSFYPLLGGVWIVETGYGKETRQYAVFVLWEKEKKMGNGMRNVPFIFHRFYSIGRGGL